MIESGFSLEIVYCEDLKAIAMPHFQIKILKHYDRMLQKLLV